MFSLDIAEAQFATRVLTKTTVGGSLPILSIVSKGFAPAVPATWACNYSNNTLWVLDTFTFNKVYHDVDDTSLLINTTYFFKKK